MNKAKISASEALMIIFDTLRFLKARNALSGPLANEDFQQLQELYPRKLLHQRKPSVLVGDKLAELENLLRASFQKEIAWELTQFISEIRLEIHKMNSLQSIQFPAAGARSLQKAALQQAA